MNSQLSLHLFKSRTLVEFLLLIVSLGVLLSLAPPLPAFKEQGDFRSYWISAYLLTRGENIYSEARVFELQRRLTDSPLDFPLITHSPPWSILIVMPYLLVPFAHAIWLWLITNTLLLALAVMLFWQLASSQRQSRGRWWIALVATFSFSITLTTLVSGQTSIFVLGMLVVFMIGEKKRSDFLAGMALVALLVKPQTVFVTILLLAAYAVRERRWRIAQGAAATLGASGLLLFVLRPAWLLDYWQIQPTINMLAWETSSLGGVLFVLTGNTNFKFIGLLAVPVFFWIWLHSSRKLQLPVWIDLSLLLSVIASPYGYSYDQVVLLLPVLRVLLWAVEGVYEKKQAIAIVSTLIVVNAASFVVRVSATSEVYFFWLPLAIALLYAYALARPRLNKIRPLALVEL